MAPRATMATVAAVAGVSIPTVSRALSGNPEISEETRLRVVNAVKSTGYSRRGRQRRSGGGVIDLVVDDASTLWSAEFIAGAERAAFEFDFTLAVVSTCHPNFRLAHWADNRRSRGAVGVVAVLTTATHREISAWNRVVAPLVLLDPIWPNNPSIPTVGATNWAGGLAATRHLLCLGHTRIGFVGGPADHQRTRERQEGYLAAHHEGQITPDPSLVALGDSLLGGGKASGGRLLDHDNPPTAIFAGSDAQAAGVYHAAAARNVRIPQDLSVVGFDDTAIGALLTPSLTTVRQPRADMAAEAVRLIAEETTHRTPSRGRRVELATSLVIRDSTTTR